MKKILFFCVFPNEERGFTGANIGNKVTYELLKDDYDIDIIDIGSKTFNTYDFNWRITLNYNFLVLKNYLNNWLKLRATLKNYDYDYFYFLPASSLKGHFRDLVTIWIAGGRVKHIVGHNRNGNFYEIWSRKWHRFLTKLFIVKVDRFIFLSDNLKLKCSGFIPNHNSKVIYNPIDKETICSSVEVKDKIQNRKGREWLHILFLSNMIISKGYQDVLKMAKILKEEHNFEEFSIDMIGRWNSVEDKRNAENFIKENSLENFVRFHGKITDRSIVKNFYLNADVFILPTYYPVEAQPRSIIEAMSAGTPIISTCHASIPEMVENNIDGYLVAKKDPKSLAKAVLQLQDFNTWKTMAENSRKKYISKFSTPVIQEKLIEVLSQLSYEK